MTTTTRQSGQITIGFAGVLALGLFLAVALVLIGEAMVHRARARTAADMVALAGAASPEETNQLRGWYWSQGVDVQVAQSGDGVTAYAASGPSQARAWAAVTSKPADVSPALQAIVARVEQLRGVTFAAIQWDRDSFVLGGDHGLIMRSMQAEFLVCSSTRGADLWEFEMC